ncbi:MAG: hypothetical protein ACI7YS_07085 [Flavobacterium sp.]
MITMSPISEKKPVVILLAILFTISAITIGYIALGFWPAFIFTFGYLGGLIIWLFMPMKVSFKQIAAGYFVTLALFVVHKFEEREYGFFPALSEITGVPVPEASSLPAILLYIIAAIWLFIPLFIWKRYAFGYYLAWTFFASMGITELAHFVFPLFRNQPYGYFPGMWSVIGLAPAAWFGMWCLSTKTRN